MLAHRTLWLVLLLGLLLGAASSGAALAAPGDLDRSFGTTGLASADFGGADTGRGVAIQPDGKVVIAGFTSAGVGGNDFAVARLAVGARPHGPRRAMSCARRDRPYEHD